MPCISMHAMNYYSQIIEVQCASTMLHIFAKPLHDDYMALVLS